MDSKKPLFGSAAKGLASFTQLSDQKDSWLEVNDQNEETSAESSKTADGKQPENLLISTPSKEDAPQPVCFIVMFL